MQYCTPVILKKKTKRRISSPRRELEISLGPEMVMAPGLWGVFVRFVVGMARRRGRVLLLLFMPAFRTPRRAQYTPSTTSPVSIHGYMFKDAYTSIRSIWRA